MWVLKPSFLLAHPELVESTAPWCCSLDNLELALLLVAIPWDDGAFRRSEMQSAVERLADRLPVGPLYFQRVRRSTSALEQRGALTTTVSGRTKRFSTTPEGFVSLLLNLRVLRADPTLDAGEFEFKRALVTLWNLTLGQLGSGHGDVGLSEGARHFLTAVEGVRLWDQPVVTARLLNQATSLLELLSLQRVQVEALRRRVVESAQAVSAIQPASRFLLPGLVTTTRGEPLQQLLQSSAGVPRQMAAADVCRYDAFLSYLDRLEAHYRSVLEPSGLSTHLRLRPGDAV